MFWYWTSSKFVQVQASAVTRHSWRHPTIGLWYPTYSAVAKWPNPLHMYAPGYVAVAGVAQRGCVNPYRPMPAKVFRACNTPAQDFAARVAYGQA